MKGNIKLISGKRIRSPITNQTRPTTSKVREAIINILGKDLEGSSWLDLCSGTGVMACEVFQKGATRILAIENHRATSKICELNLNDVSNNLDKSSHCEVISKDVISFLKKGPKDKKIKFIQNFQDCDERFDFVFLDPPYDLEIYELSQKILLSRGWVKNTSTLICEYSSKSLPAIHNGWKLIKKKIYGNTSLLFLIPNQALNCFDDTDSMH